MNSYFHSSTVFRARRETEALRIFLQLGPVGLVKRDKPRTGMPKPDFVFLASLVYFSWMFPSSPRIVGVLFVPFKSP
jgi:hypothetical protein